MTRTPVVSDAFSASGEAHRGVRRRASALVLALVAVSLGACSTDSITDPIPSNRSRLTGPQPRSVECIQTQMHTCDPTRL